MAKRSALGKGLGAILGDSKEMIGGAVIMPPGENPAIVSAIPLRQIEPNPYQPRESFDDEALAELAESIRTLGIIQPLTLRQVSAGHYQIISGERRFRAAKAAGLKTVPAYIRKADDQAMLEMAIVENIQRENLDPIETAMSFQRLISECNLTQEDMARRVGKKRATVTNYLRLLKLPVEIQKAIKIGKISAGHAKALLSVEDEEKQLALCAQIIEADLSVRQAEEKVRRMAEKAGREQEPEPVKDELPESCSRLAEIVGKYADNKVAIRRTARGGSVMTVRFKSLDQMEKFLKVIERKKI